MSSSKIRSGVLLIILSFIVFSGWAQENDIRLKEDFSDESLKEFMQIIESRYGLEFYYNETDISDKKAGIDCTGKLFSECLENICRSNLLNYYRIDKRIYLFKGKPVKESLLRKKIAETEIQVSEDKKKDLDELKQQSFKIHEIGIPGKNNTGYAVLRGYVTNYETEEPVSNASIIVAGTTRGISTNQKGYYEIRLPIGNNTLQFSSIGMEPAQRIVNIYSDGRLDVQMQTKINVIGDIDIFGEQNGEVSSVFSGVERFEGEMLESLPALLGEPDVIKSTLMLPGVATVGEGTVGFNVRGGKTDQNLILIDNVPIFYPSHFFGNFSAINSDVVDDAILFKGSIPSKYGGRISSVYEINTKDGNAKEISGAGGVGLYSARLMLEGPVAENSAFVLSSRGTYSDWILNQIKVPELYNSEVGFYDVHGKLNLQLNKKNWLKVSGYASNDRFKLRSDTLYRYKNLISSAELEHSYNENWRSDFSLAVSNFSYNISGSQNPELAFSMTHDVAHHSFKNYNEFKDNSRLKVYFGLESVWYKVNPGQLESPPQSQFSAFLSGNEDAVEYALFSGAEFPVTPLLNLEAGFRWSGFLALENGRRYVYAPGSPIEVENIADTISANSNEIKKFYNIPEFRISANYILSQYSSLKFSYNKTTQYIHILTNSTAVSPTDTWKLSDEFLPPQIGHQVSAGINTSFWQEHFETSLEGFYKRIKNMVEYKPGASLVLNDHIETEIINGIGKAYGVEASLKKKGNRLSGWIGYTWSRILIRSDSDFPEEQINNGEYFPASYDKPHNLNVFANLKASRRLIFSSTLNYTTGRPITYPVAKYKLGDKIMLHYSKYNQYRIPDYFRVDLSLTLKGNLKSDKLVNSSATLSVYNVTARKNAYSVYFRGKRNVLEGYKLSIFGTAIPTITFNFKF